MTQVGLARREVAFHRPAMVASVVRWLGVGPGSLVVDTTVGGGGHAQAILRATAPDGSLIGIDRDPDAIRCAQDQLKWAGGRVRLIKGLMGQLSRILDQAGISQVDGILADLGVSGFQFDSPWRGFGFGADGPLDMRMDPSQGPSAAELLASMDVKAVENVLREYGQERYARRIARALVGQEIRTTKELASAVVRAVPRRTKTRIHPATRTFQALRIAVNDELGELDRFLAQAPGRLAPGGRLVVISYHSLEDRRVKRVFAQAAREGGFGLPQRKVLRPDPAEVTANPRVRSARLRVLERLSG
jgi:16S rRNA (cytosine1402-N4)-methyltransferase